MRKLFNLPFLRDESGSASVEMAIWFPMYLALIGSVVDLSLGLHQMSTAWDVARDVTRKVAVGEFTSAEGEQYASDRFPGATISIDQSNPQDVVFTMSVTPDLLMWDFSYVKDFAQINVDYIMRSETSPDDVGFVS